MRAGDTSFFVAASPWLSGLGRRNEHSIVSPRVLRVCHVRLSSRVKRDHRGRPCPAPRATFRLEAAGFVLDDALEHLLANVRDDRFLSERGHLLDGEQLLELDVALDRAHELLGLGRIRDSHLLEVLAREHVDPRVRAGLDVHGPARVEQQPDLADVVALAELLHEGALRLVRIDDRDLRGTRARFNTCLTYTSLSV